MIYIKIIFYAITAIWLLLAASFVYDFWSGN